MAESTLRGVTDEVTQSPAADRLKQELQDYLKARAERTVTGLGQRLGDDIGKFAEGGSPVKALAGAGASQLKDAVKDKAKQVLRKGGGRGGGGKSKSVTIVEDIDVGVPVREAYDQWTQFQEFSTFAKGVVSVEKSGDTASNWKVKVAKSTRSLRANVTEQIPDERITWTTQGAKGTVRGVVTFHALTEDLTRVLLVLEYFPGGFFEKTGNIWRAQGRRARLDLKLFRKFLMMRGEATDGWRGEVRDGEVVLGHEDAVAEEEQDEEEQDEPDQEYEEDEPEEGPGEEAQPEEEDDER